MNIDRERFFKGYRDKFGKLTQVQVNALDSLLDSIESDGEIEDVRHIAYILATIKHETANTFEPIEEYGKGRGHQYGVKDRATGQAYYGRGFVQLTWKRNYKLFADLLNIDLLHKPELALNPKFAWLITSIGMREGSFTGKSLNDYIQDEKCDYKNARKIINGLDKAALIAGYAQKFESILRAAETPDTIQQQSGLDSPISEPSELTRNQLSSDSVNAQPAQAIAQETATQQVAEGATGVQVIQPNALDAKPPVSSPFDEPIRILKGKSSNLMNWILGTTGLGGAIAFVKENPGLVIFFFSLVFLGALAILIINHHKKVIEAKTAADPGQYKVQFVKEAK